MKIVVMTQADRFFIPTNIAKLAVENEILEIVQVDCKSALENKIGDYYRWFGFLQCAKMGFISGWTLVQCILDSLCGYRIYGGTKSVQSIARKLHVPHRVIHDSNSPNYVEHIRELNPDLIVSFSAPQIIRQELLSVPKYGIVNVHGSLLPDFRGTLPSFWYLYEQEKVGGATVHYMSAKIDDGDIIEQGSVDISDCTTMFELMKRTKKLGGELMVKAVREIAEDSVQPKKNEVDKGRYFTWPTDEQAKEFRRKGYRLV